MSYNITTYSNRFYINEYKDYPSLIDKGFIKACDETISSFNKSLFRAYNLYYLKETNEAKYKKIVKDKLVFKYLKDGLGLSSYYISSIINLVQGKVKAQVTLNKDYIKQKKESIKSLENKLNETQKKLDKYLTLRDSFLEYRDEFLKNDKLKFKAKGITNITFNGYEIRVRYPSKNKIIVKNYNLYSFEYEYLNIKINHLKSLINLYNYRINNLKTKIKNLEKIKPIIFKKKLLDEMNRESNPVRKALLKQKFLDAKYKEFNIPGRNDAKFGNFVFKTSYISSKDNFNIEIMLKDKTITLTDIVFPSYKKELISILSDNLKNKKKSPICFGIIRKKDKSDERTYYQIKLSFDISSTKKYINESIDSGIIGMDFNYGHIDLTEIDSNGNMVNCFTVPYKISTSSIENELSLKKAMHQVGEYVSSKHKCLVTESLDTKTSKYKFNKEKTNQKALNNTIHTLSTDKYNRLTDYIGIKYNFKVFRVNPAYTSIIGKLKYSYTKKLNSHIAASFVIARRGLLHKSEELLQEQFKTLPKELKYKNDWSQWSYLNKN